jgi:hypothetical protein
MMHSDSATRSQQQVDEAERPYGSRAPQAQVPDFFIVGHAKCGTTALYEALRHHPQIYMSDDKEPQFFATEIRNGEWRGSGRPPETLDDYLTLFAAAKPDQRVGEASVFHLWSRVAAKGIADLQPDARIIAILREPASFLRSLHLQFLQSHIETEKDLRKALSLEDARRQGRQVPRSSPAWQQLLLYSDHVRYSDQLRRYRTVFPSEHVLVLIYDDFRRDNETTVRRILRFLDVDDTFPVNVAEVNPTVRVRSEYLDDLVRTVSMGQGPVSRTIKAGIKTLTPRQLRRNALALTQHHIVYDNPRPPDEELMMELRHRFKPEVVALSEYLDRDFVTLWGYDRIG